VIHGALSTGLVTMVQEALVSELLEQLLSGSGDEQASAAQTVCELCCERRGYTQARRCRAPGTAAPGCTRSEALGGKATQGQRSSRQAKHRPHVLAAAARQAGERGPGVQAFAEAGVVGPLVGLLEREGQCQAASARALCELAEVDGQRAAMRCAPWSSARRTDELLPVAR